LTRQHVWSANPPPPSLLFSRHPSPPSPVSPLPAPVSPQWKVPWQHGEVFPIGLPVPVAADSRDPGGMLRVEVSCVCVCVCECECECECVCVCVCVCVCECECVSVSV
jgi:hypothetical protein